MLMLAKNVTKHNKYIEVHTSDKEDVFVVNVYNRIYDGIVIDKSYYIEKDLFELLIRK